MLFYSYQEPILFPSISRHGNGTSTPRNFLVMERATWEPGWTVPERVRVAEMVTVAPVWSSRGSGRTVSSSMDPGWGAPSDNKKSFAGNNSLSTQNSPQNPYSSCFKSRLFAETRAAVAKRRKSFMVFHY